MSNKIYISSAILSKTPDALKNLVEGRYRLSKLRYKDNPTHGKHLPDQFERTGSPSIFNNGGEPGLAIGTLHTSPIVEATQDPSNPNAVLFTTANSHYKLEGPLSEES